jgi:hypothetical protein
MTLTEQKLKETKAELKEWLNKDLSREDLTTNGIERVNKKLEEARIPRSIINGFESINRWYNNLFIYELLDNSVSKNKVDGSVNGYHIVLLYNEFIPQFPNNPLGPSFANTAYYFANCISEKWYQESKNLLNIINAGLDSGLLEGGDDFKPSAWFIIEIANKGYNIVVDYSKFNYPKNMGVYQEALNNWNTNDLVLLDTIVTKLCDYHLSQASFGDISDNAGDNDPMFLQFSTVKEFVYAYEILTWLSIREMIGVKNPEKFSHPLMNLALNKLPTVVTPMPKNELFERVLEKLKQ